MNRKRETHNFTDGYALSPDWHRAGMQYIEVRVTYRADVLRLDLLAQSLSPDDRFAVDLLPIGKEGVEAHAHGYIFRSAKEDDHQFRLGSLDHKELLEIIKILDGCPGIVDFQATECSSTDVRGRPRHGEKFRKQK